MLPTLPGAPKVIKDESGMETLAPVDKSESEMPAPEVTLSNPWENYNVNPEYLTSAYDLPDMEVGSSSLKDLVSNVGLSRSIEHFILIADINALNPTAGRQYYLFKLDENDPKVQTKIDRDVSKHLCLVFTCFSGQQMAYELDPQKAGMIDWTEIDEFNAEFEAKATRGPHFSYMSQMQYGGSRSKGLQGAKTTILP